MKKFLVISDFDGTISQEDFYKKIMHTHQSEKIHTSFKDFKAEKIKDIDFLNDIFMNMDLDEEEIDKEILGLKIDPQLKALIECVREMGGDFIILSAGCEYYIHKILKSIGLQGIPVFSNKGIYKERGMHITPDQQSEFYSERYGIDKEKVVMHFKEQYEYIVYIGDSAPDFKASLHADKRFGKDELINLYNKAGVEHSAITCLKDVIAELSKNEYE